LLRIRTHFRFPCEAGMNQPGNRQPLHSVTGTTGLEPAATPPPAPASMPPANPLSGRQLDIQPSTEAVSTVPPVRHTAGEAPVRRSEIATELETLIRARYPLLQIVSWEEERVLKLLDEIAASLGKQLWTWTINGGLVQYRVFGSRVAAPADGPKGTRDPLVALRDILGQAGEPTIYVLKDFHPYLDESSVVRALRDLAIALRSTYSTCILLSPKLVLPAELEKDVTVVDFPLPERDDLLRLFDSLASDLRGNTALTFENNEETRQRLLEAAIGLTMNEVENVCAKILVRRGRLSAAEVPEVYHEKRQIIRKSGVLEYIDPEETIENVGGLTRLKEWLRKRRRAFHPMARRFGLPMPKGVLFLGVQGCGKSLCAKAVSRFWQMPLLRLDMGQLFGSLVGASEENVRRAIRIAESIAPVILWIDEIDKGFAGLSSSSFSDAGTTSRVFGTLLTWLQEKKAPVFVIATANNVEILPPELLRQGRFDEIFFVDLPTPDERREILRIHITSRRRNPAKYDLDALAAACDGFSGAEIEQVVVSALYDAFDEEHDITQENLLHAIGATRPLAVLMKEEIQKRRTWAQSRTRPAS
jgi:SpoVK/Ycf46/Vps4 family AAA+-type ATPase